MRKTKIVCTIGPSSSPREILEALIEKGMDVARLNFSHGTHESHLQVINDIREISARKKKAVAILQDLCGPKIRLGNIPNGPVEIRTGDLFTIVEKEIDGDAARATVTYKALDKEARAGERILIDDGLVELKVEEVGEGELRCRVVTGGYISSHKGVNLPGTVLSIPSLTEKDLDDLRFGIDSKVDFIAISFVRSDKDLDPAYKVMEEKGHFIPIISKIEKGEAVQSFDGILQRSFGIMVARGDMGVELPFEEVPLIQKHLIKLCQAQAKPVITATQMLDSMIRNPMPTRAEVTDVANAILDGTDAIMLSGETASGKYPLQAVEAMVKIAEYTEKSLPYEDVFTRLGEKKNAVGAISLATCEVAEQMDAEAIIVSTSSGRTARSISKYKPRPPVIAITDSPENARVMVLSWGVFPRTVKPSKDINAFFNDMCIAAVESGIVKKGDLTVITAGIPEGLKGSTNAIMLHVLGHSFIRGIGAGKAATATGKAVFITSPAEAGTKLGKGDIAVLHILTAEYEKALSVAGGVVCEKGEAVSEAAEIVKRLDIPAVFSAPQAFELLKDGENVTIDPEHGIVTI
jgi:pyruvate kinase